MTDHPMSCYPGHLETWKPGARVWMPDTDELYLALLGGNLREHESYERAADRIIGRAMAGQITSIPGHTP